MNELNDKWDQMYLLIDMVYHNICHDLKLCNSATSCTKDICYLYDSFNILSGVGIFFQ